jgi:hypothetical protein
MKKIELFILMLCCFFSSGAAPYVLIYENGSMKTYYNVGRDGDGIDSLVFSPNYSFFCVGNGRYVEFAEGNVQYQPSTKSWRFAENPWDVVGEDNLKVNDSTYTGWIDLFYYSREDNNFGLEYSSSGEFVDWGVNFGGENKNVYSYRYDTVYGASYLPSEYETLLREEHRKEVIDVDVDCSMSHITGECDTTYTYVDINEYDYVKKVLLDVVYVVEGWHVLTASEWRHLNDYRPNAKYLKFEATLHEVNGWVYLPDDFVNPGVKISYESVNALDDVAWGKLKAVGAVFFPSAGSRDGEEYQKDAWNYHRGGPNSYDYTGTVVAASVRLVRRARAK